MELTILSEHFKVVDTKEKITIADSFVFPQNKIGSGNGEAKLYIGQDNKDTRELFGGSGFSIPCFLLKKDLLQYLEDTKVEYLNPEQPYRTKEGLAELWLERKSEVELLDDKIDFEISEQSQIEGPRVYVNSSDSAYKLIRKLSLPNITYISVVKLLNDSGRFQYYFRLFADYFGEVEHPYSIKKEQEEKVRLEGGSTGKARVGQSKYRERLLEQCPRCPITLISDERILRASHIKPWAKSNDFEKTDPYNGFMLTPTFDILFDQGFMSFTDDKKTILSPFLSNMTYSKLNISDNKTFPHLPVEGREEYLSFHRSNILKR
jgi:hypothetical protein